MSKRVVLSQPLATAEKPLAAACELQVMNPPGLRDRGAPRVELATCQGLVCLLTDSVDAALLDAMPRLEFVATVSVGVDHVDVAALTARGIPLGNTPGVLVDATADQAFALLLAAARRVAEADRYVRAGQWRPERAWAPDFFLGKDVSGATLGIVGLGQIGQALARRAAGFDMEILGWTPSGRRVDGVTPVSLQDLLRRSDFVSVHVALTPETHKLLDAARIAAMKPGAVLINTARGGIVDERALVEALDTDHLYAAGLDVFECEPLPGESPLLQHPRVVFTPHLGSATVTTRSRMVALAVANSVAALRGERMPHCVNPEVYPD